MYEFFARRFLLLRDNFKNDPASFKLYVEMGERYFEYAQSYIDLADHYLCELIAQAQAAGMQVHPWTVRAENAFLPPVLQKGQDPAAHGDAAAILRALYAAGVDGVFTDFPDLAARVRAEMFDG